MANIPISSFTAAANATGIGMSGFSLTGANAQSMLDLAGTWNTSGTPTGLKLNVTDTASNANSLLIDLQVGGTSRFALRKDGQATFGGIGINVPGNVGLSLGTDIASIRFGAAGDLFVTRDAANTLAQRNGVNEQAFRVYNTFTDASNYERARIAWVSNTLQIGTDSAGTGSTSRNISINAQNGAITFTAGFNLCWQINNASHFVTGVDNLFDIGASGMSRPRRLFLAGGSLTGTQADSSLTISPTWNTTGTPTAVLLNVTDTASNANSLLMDLQVGGVSKFSVTKGTAIGTSIRLNSNGGFAIIDAIGNSLTLSGNTGNHDVNLPGAIFQRSAVNFGLILGTSTAASSPILYGSAQEANHTIAQRNGTNAQTLRVYNTFTDASNYERGFVRWNANALQIGSESAGTGVARGVVLLSADHLDLQSAAARSIRFAPGGTAVCWLFNASSHFIAATDNAFDIGASGANRPRNLYMGSWIRMATTTVASLPAAATAGAGARMFVTDASGPVFGSAVVGGGAVTVPVYSTGSAWNVG